MRGNIVVPDNVRTIIGFTPSLAWRCEELSRERYLKARGTGGLTAAQSITGMHRQIQWCRATLEGTKLAQISTNPLSQSGLSKRCERACSQLDAALKKYKTRTSLRKLLVLPNPEFLGMIAFRADYVIDITNVIYQVYQYHLRRAFYTFNHDSGFLFPGGDRYWLKQYEASVISKLFPIW